MLENKGSAPADLCVYDGSARIVKNFFRDMVETCKCPPGLPVCVCGWKPKLKLVTRHPLAADGILTLARAIPRAATSDFCVNEIRRLNAVKIRANITSTGKAMAINQFPRSLA